MSLKLPRSRALRVVLYISLFLALIGSGRVGQKAWDGLWFGDRGPYLQMPAPGAMSVRWETAEPTVGRIRYGLAPDRLEHAIGGGEAAWMHELRLTGLTPATRYFYLVEADGRPLMDGEPQWFITPPASGSAQATRLWVIGDSGKAGEDQRRVRDAALAWMTAHPRTGRAPLDVWLALGDNAYTSGRNKEFQRALFEPYAELLCNFPLWPVYGNHDARRWVHYDIFSLPEGGESGGVPSGTESWFSFDYGDVHVVVLDSEANSRSGAMLRWLKQDLVHNRSPWRIAVFHHPPYTHGSHNSDRPEDSGGRMRDMREGIVPVLEAAGVDLVLAGHSHVYERSHLLDCHYGTSDTMVDGMVLSRGEVGQAVFSKPARGPVGHGGTVYAVVGSSSKVDRGPLDHPAHAVALMELGSLVIDIDGERLDARFINSSGEVSDEFAIVKNAGPAIARSGLCAGSPGVQGL